MSGYVRWHKHVTAPNGWTEWIPAARLHKIACCDCGLIHAYQFTVYQGVIYFRARRRNGETAARRKKVRYPMREKHERKRQRTRPAKRTRRRVRRKAAKA